MSETGHNPTDQLEELIKVRRMLLEGYFYSIGYREALINNAAEIRAVAAKLEPSGRPGVPIASAGTDPVTEEERGRWK